MRMTRSSLKRKAQEVLHNNFQLPEKFDMDNTPTKDSWSAPSLRMTAQVALLPGEVSSASRTHQETAASGVCAR